MGISRRYAYRLAILTVLVAFSLGMVVAANSEANISNKTSSSVGTNMTNKVSIIAVNSTGMDQWIMIANNGMTNTTFTGWKLTNKENQTYAFPSSFVLKPGAKVQVHSIAGKPNSTNLYNSSVLLNKTGDMAILKDAIGEVVSKYSYSSIVVAKPTTNATKKPNIVTTEVVYKTNTTSTARPN